ncbi:ABC transporter permease [Bifidobacterium criceti]|uniref:ABC transporter permease protein n=1 Tax=Bifidobacterium criceti TaxID=1960969 RepID=A0A2A2EDJ8_9BIFI|nr:ABC transporter permease [Bifidobacterium criceti]PAU67091.1 aBC transporter permease protein [Bifidobacterium criceti]
MKMVLRQFANCLDVACKLLFRGGKSLIIMMMFPIAGVAIVIAVAGDNVYHLQTATKSVAFLLMCTCIWGGLFNSVQVVVKQRTVLQADLAAGLYPFAFMLANAIVQFLLCAFQSAVLCLCFPGIALVYDARPPSSGALIGGAGGVYWEYYITFLLLFYASDALGMVISTLMKSAETATSVTPYILIVELVFCGMLFELKGILNKISYGMISRWGMEALGTTSDLNCLPLKDPKDEDANSSSGGATGAGADASPSPSAAEGADGTEGAEGTDGIDRADVPSTDASIDPSADPSALGDANADAAAGAADPSALAAAKPELPDDLSYCPSGMKDEMLDGGGFKYSDDYLYNDWHIAKAWIILGCTAVALFIVADILVHRFKNTNNLGRE